MRTLIYVLLASTLSAAELARKPYIQNVSATHASIIWTTTGSAGNSALSWGPDLVGPMPSARPRTRSIPTAESGSNQSIWQHQADLTDLRPDTLYYYRLTIDGTDVLTPVAAASEWRFRTAAHDPFTFLVIGDSGDGGTPQREIASAMAQEDASLILHVGDLAYYQGTFAQFEQYYFGVYGDQMRRVPVFPAPGNHDYEFAHGLVYLGAHSVPSASVPAAGVGRYYSFDWGSVHFVSLDSNPAEEGTLPQEMVKWLEQDLENTQRWFRVVYFHHTPFPTALYYGNAWCTEVRSILTPILERQQVHLVLSGHEHLYQRSKPRMGEFLEKPPGTIYVTTGGAGSNTYSPGDFPFVAAAAGVSHYTRAAVNGNMMAVEAIGKTQNVVDTFRVDASPVVLSARSAADGAANAAPGGLLSIYGFGLAQRTASPQAGSFPVEVEQVTASMGKYSLPLLFVSRAQINAHVPAALVPGDYILTVQTSAGHGSVQVRIDASAPAVFRIRNGGSSLPAVIHLDGTLVQPQAAAITGEWISVFLTGLGTPAAPVRVTIDGLNAEVSYAGQAPGLTGVDQINARVPAVTRSGASALQIITSAGSTVVPDLYVGTSN